eukprot:2662664-Rhodomonas_salina.1
MNFLQGCPSSYPGTRLCPLALRMFRLQLDEKFLDTHSEFQLRGVPEVCRNTMMCIRAPSAARE